LDFYLGSGRGDTRLTLLLSAEHETTEWTNRENGLRLMILSGFNDDFDDGLEEVKSELSRLRQEHRDLDSAIEALETMGANDKLQIQRLKKRKLTLKDRITALEDQLTPDIIA
jgi:hypothetical protein